MVKNQCLLCQTKANPKSKWSAVIDDQVAKSLARLLEKQSDNFLEFFRKAEYCEPCQEFVLEIDFLMHSLSSIQSKINRYRTKLSHLLLETGSLWNESDFQEEECSEIDVKILDGEFNDNIESSSLVSPLFGSQAEADVHMPPLIQPEAQSPDSDKLSFSTEASSIRANLEHSSSKLISVVPVEIAPNPPGMLTDCEPTPNTIPSNDFQAQLKPRKLKEIVPQKPEVLVTIILSSSENLVPVTKQTQTRSIASVKNPSVPYIQSRSDSYSDSDSASEPAYDSDAGSPGILQDGNYEVQLEATDQAKQFIADTSGTLYSIEKNTALNANTEPVEAVPTPADIQNIIQPEPELNPCINIQSTESQSKNKSTKRNPEVLDKVRKNEIASSSEEQVSVRRQTRSSVAVKKPSISYIEIQSGSSESEHGSGSGSDVEHVNSDHDKDFIAHLSEDDDSDFEDDVQLCEANNARDPAGHNKSTANELIDTPRAAEKNPSLISKEGCDSLDHQKGHSRIRKLGRPRKNLPRQPRGQDYDYRAKRPRIDPRPDGRFECYRENCTVHYFTARDLRRHIFEKHPDRTAEEDDKLIPTRYRHNCKEPGCSYFGRSEGKLKIHVEKEHRNNPRPYKCKLCTKEYSKVNSLRTHEVQKHTETKTCVCDICGGSYGTRPQLQVHFKLRHNEVERFRCTICNKKLLFEDDWKFHEERHARLGRDNWTCVVMTCYLKFDNQNLLKQHVVVHDTVKVNTFICEVCGINYTVKKDLQYHLLSHQTDPLPYKCSNCEKRFKRHYHRQSHMEIVHGAANGQVYPCKLYEKTFHCRAYLHKHTAWHKHGVNANKPKAKQVRNSESD